MKQPHISCPKCNGTGQTVLTKALRSTLKAIRELQSVQGIGPPTNAQIHIFLKERGHVSTTFRRTERLVGIGLIKKHQRNGSEATFSEVG